MQCIFAGTISIQNMKCFCKRYALWRSTICISTCLTFFSKEQYPFSTPIFLHKMQYYWHRTSFSKVPHIWKYAILWECSFAPYNKELSFTYNYNKPIFLWRSCILRNLVYLCWYYIYIYIVPIHQPRLHLLWFAETTLTWNNVLNHPK